MEEVSRRPSVENGGRVSQRNKETELGVRKCWFETWFVPCLAIYIDEGKGYTAVTKRSPKTALQNIEVYFYLIPQSQSKWSRFPGKLQTQTHSKTQIPVVLCSHPLGCSLCGSGWVMVTSMICGPSTQEGRKGGKCMDESKSVVLRPG